MKHKQKTPLKITLKLATVGKLTSRYRSSKTKRIFHLVKANNFSKAYLKVDYGNGYYNDGIYLSKNDLIRALSAFTEKSLAKSLTKTQITLI